MCGRNIPDRWHGLCQCPERKGVTKTFKECLGNLPIWSERTQGESWGDGRRGGGRLVHMRVTCN